MNQQVLTSTLYHTAHVGNTGLAIRPGRRGQKRPCDCWAYALQGLRLRQEVQRSDQLRQQPRPIERTAGQLWPVQR